MIEWLADNKRKTESKEKGKTYMKQLRKAISVLLAMMLAAGCATGTTQEPPAETEEAVQETEAPAEETEPAAAAVNTKGGSPWLDTDLKENLEGLEKPSEKDDFYFASNYDWLTTAVIAPGKSSVNAFNEVKDGTDKRAINLLENSTETDHNTELVQTLYKTILDWDSRDALGTKPAEEVLEVIKNISSIEELNDFITDPDASFSVTTLLALAVDASMNDSSKYTVWVGCEDFLLEDAAEYSERTDYGQRRYDSVLYLLKHMLPRLGYTEADAKPMLDQAIDFEAKIAEAAYTSADRMSPDYVTRINNVMTPEELKELSPVFPLFRLAEGYGFGAAKEFQVDNPEHIKRVNEVYTEENLDAIKALLMITCIRKLAPMMDKDSYDVHVEANNIKSGASGKQPDETVAFDQVRKNLYGPMDQAYLAMYDYSKTKEEVVELIHEIIDHYRSMLEQEDWLTEDTRKKAIEKLENMQINAVYPDKWEDYSGLDLTGLSYPDCIKAIDAFSNQLAAEKVNGLVDHEIWLFDTLEPNAYYNPLENSINIILGLLGDPVYEPGKSSREVLMGTVGVIIGHEISHAFDPSGARFDKDGNLNSWWTEEDTAAFQERADKLIKYYDGITIWEGLNCNGKNIQGEVVADMGGIKVLLDIAKDDPSFDYDEFFRAFAVLFRRINTQPYEYTCATQDTHPLHYLRINVTLAQFEEFQKTYGITEGDGMYIAPEDRVLIW